MLLTSTAFEPGGEIPEQYTCKGANQSPDLSWHDEPDATKSFALIVEDPDAPDGLFTHWVAFDIPEKQKTLGEGDGGVFPQGTNSFGEIGYGGPCPPQGHGPHRYFFKLFALDKTLHLEPGIEKEDLMEAMDGHVLARAELMGTYELT